MRKARVEQWVVHGKPGAKKTDLVMASKDFYVEPKNESVNQKSALAGCFPEYRLCNADKSRDSE